MTRATTISVLAVCLLLMMAAGPAAPARTYSAGPENYLRMLRLLSPGDTLLLAPGVYRRGLRIHDMHGEDRAPIIITGSTGDPPTIFLGQSGRNTVSIRNAAHVTVRDLELDGRGAFVDAVKAEGHADYAHHITLENLYIHSYAAQQQSVGISTKCPAWDWVVRGNRIEGVGTGMYFGNSDGSDPFIGGLIEENEVVNTIGYNLQIKHQAPRPAIDGMPTEPRMTIIRRNRFIKAEDASSDVAARPNVLVGHLPVKGPGSTDEYAIYANLFFQNPSEALFQGEGNLALYSNVFFNSHANDFPAIAIQPHNDIPRRVRVLFNTVVHPLKGIRVLRREDRWVDDQLIIGNAVFAGTPLQGGAQGQNFIDEYEAAAEYLNRPVPDLEELDLSPRCGELLGAAIDLSRFTWLPESDHDYLGVVRDGNLRGAMNP